MAGKVSSFLNDDILEFIRQSEALCPADVENFSVAQQRKLYSELSAAFAGEWPDNVKTENEFYRGREGSIPVRHYINTQREPKGRVVFFHGGGFILGGFDTHDSICADLCDRSGCDVTAVDYRLAPEHTHPAAFDDCFTAVRRVASEWRGPLILVGDSAGGNLAAAVSHSTRGESCHPDGQVLIYPALGGAIDKGSYVTFAQAPLLTTEDVKYYHELRGGGRDLSRDPTANPLDDENFAGLPETVVFAAQCDPLCDDGRSYCAKMTKAGGSARFVEEKGLVHGYLRARNSVPDASDSFARIVDAIDQLVSKV